MRGGADPNSIGSLGARIPIVDAANYCVEYVEPLLLAGANPEVRNSRGERAVALLIRNGHWNIAMTIFAAGANPNELIPSENGPAHPFCLALRVPDPQLIDRLAGYGADPRTLDTLGGNSLHCALRQLLRYGGPTDPNSLIPFEASVLKLVSYGLNVTDSARIGASVLHQVAQATQERSSTSGYRSNPQRYVVALRLARFFIGLGAPTELTDAASHTPLAALINDRRLAGFYGHNNLPDFFALAQVLGTNRAVNIVDRDGRTPLMLLIAQLHSETELDVQFVRYLISQGTDLPLKDSLGNTAYGLALEKNLLRIAWEVERNGGRP